MPRYDDPVPSLEGEQFPDFRNRSGKQIQDELSLDPISSQRAEQVQQERLRFDAKFSALLDRESSDGRLIFTFIQRELRRFRLQNYYQDALILNEVYFRGVERIATGEVIRNLPAWVRSTAYNIIRELSREYQKSSPLQEESLDSQQPPVSCSDLEDDFATVRMAFQLLSPEDQRLLNLKIVENHSWKEIRTILKREGAGDLPEATLRKRKERALIRLREKYHAIKPPEF
jgi:DNA-directed RNA polymerase specialized sigma24 family protein